VSAFRCYLRVVSSDLQPEEISARLGTAPDEATSIGSRRRAESPPRLHATWIRRAETADLDARPEDLEPVIIGWGLDFARALGALVRSSDAVVSLEIVQRIRDLDSGREKGIFLGPDLIAWLATARASLDIDQYILHECGDLPAGAGQKRDDTGQNGAGQDGAPRE
jgi:hypothetical protein